jgi:hypothetical protein
VTLASRVAGEIYSLAGQVRNSQVHKARATLVKLSREGTLGGGEPEREVGQRQNCHGGTRPRANSLKLYARQQHIQVDSSHKLKHPGMIQPPFTAA